MLEWDRHLESWIVTHRVAALDPLFRWLTDAGVMGAIWVALGAAVALVLRRVGPLVLVVTADVAAQLSTDAIKTVVPRARPRVDALVAVPHSHSFPSGHAASSVACAIVLASFVPRLRAPLYLLAALIAFSRLYVGVHYPLDVLGGALLGGVLGYALLGLETRLGGEARSGRRSGRRSRRRSSPA
jgi:undecaprenyl-diphosphatase